MTTMTIMTMVRVTKTIMTIMIMTIMMFLIVPRAHSLLHPPPRTLVHYLGGNKVNRCSIQQKLPNINKINI